jgi:hypothetical protein
MNKPTPEENSPAVGPTAKAAEDNHDLIDEADEDAGDIVATAATVAVVGVGVAVFEAALLPGVVLGVAAMLVPKVLPNLGTALSPLFRSTVRGVYRLGQKTKEVVAEAQEHVQDIAAEVDAERDAKLAAPESAKRPPAAALDAPSSPAVPLRTSANKS